MENQEFKRNWSSLRSYINKPLNILMHLMYESRYEGGMRMEDVGVFLGC